LKKIKGRISSFAANVFREDTEKCLEAGMNDHVGKPLILTKYWKNRAVFCPEIRGRR
jgi:CheY-like chemotaxis protein